MALPNEPHTHSHAHTHLHPFPLLQKEQNKGLLCVLASSRVSRASTSQHGELVSNQVSGNDFNYIRQTLVKVWDNEKMDVAYFIVSFESFQTFHAECITKNLPSVNL